MLDQEDRAQNLSVLNYVWHDRFNSLELAEALFVRRSRVLCIGMGCWTANRDASAAAE
jgi:hypothetical protein